MEAPVSPLPMSSELPRLTFNLAESSAAAMEWTLFSRFHLNILIALNAAVGEKAFKRKLNLVRMRPDPV